jgi:hypothetical protein
MCWLLGGSLFLELGTPKGVTMVNTLIQGLGEEMTTVKSREPHLALRSNLLGKLFNLYSS